jgi:hypothetical protein
MVVIAALLAAIRVFLFPVWEANSEGAHQVATAQVQLSAAMTQEALRPMLTATASPRLAVTPVSAPASLPTQAIATQASLPTQAQQASPTELALATNTPVASSGVVVTNLPTPNPDQAAEIAAAYKKYFDTRSEALLNLNPSLLDDVAAGQSLAGLQQTIEDDRAQGKALQTNVEHEQVYVIGFQDDRADVSDLYRDSSIFVDPVTHSPLPGQVAPASPDSAPEVSVVYHLQRIDGVWKVVSGERFAPQGNS